MIHQAIAEAARQGPVQGFTVIPVVSLPQERVIVFVSSGSPIDFCIGSNAAAPMPAPVPAQTLTIYS